MKTRYKVIIGIVAAGALAAIAVPRLLKPAETVEQVYTPVVKAEAPAKGTITLSKEIIGTVEPSDIIYVMPKVAGEILEIYVNPGDTVRQQQNFFRRSKGCFGYCQRQFGQNAGALCQRGYFCTGL